MLPIISVITPVFNREKFIEDCVLSVVCSRLNSKFVVEHIIVDDGSTDSTCSVIEDCWRGYDPTLVTRKVIKIPHSGKPSIARNVGINAATGKYVFCLDSDDVILRNTLISMFDYLENNQTVDIVIGGFIRTNELLSYKIGWDYIPVTYNNNKDLLCELFTGECVLPPAAMFRKSSLDDVSGYNEDLTFAEDNDLLIRLSINKHIMHSMPLTSILYRNHSSNISNACNTDSVLIHNRKQFAKYKNVVESILSANQIKYINETLNLTANEWNNKMFQTTLNR